MEGQRPPPRLLARLKDYVRLAVQTAIFFLVIAQTICWLSGWPLLFSGTNPGPALPSSPPGAESGRVYSLSPAIKVILKSLLLSSTYTPLPDHACSVLLLLQQQMLHHHCVFAFGVYGCRCILVFVVDACACVCFCLECIHVHLDLLLVLLM